MEGIIYPEEHTSFPGMRTEGPPVHPASVHCWSEGWWCLPGSSHICRTELQLSISATLNCGHFHPGFSLPGAVLFCVSWSCLPVKHLWIWPVIQGNMIHRILGGSLLSSSLLSRISSFNPSSFANSGPYSLFSQQERTENGELSGWVLFPPAVSWQKAAGKSWAPVGLMFLHLSLLKPFSSASPACSGSSLLCSGRFVLTLNCIQCI